MLTIARAAQSGALPVKVAAVVSDKANAEGLVHAQALGIECRVLSPREYPDRNAYDVALAALIREYSPKLVVLAGFMRILSKEFVHEFSGRLFNIHPSLLPAYRGLHTHQRALDAGDRVHGCSVHFVTEELDGGPVVLQAQVPILPEDTPETLSARVQVQEHKIYPMAVDWFARDRLQWRAGRPWLDGAPLPEPVVLDGP